MIQFLACPSGNSMGDKGHKGTLRLQSKRDKGVTTRLERGSRREALQDMKQ